MKKWNFVNHMKHVPLRNASRLPAAAGVILNVIGIETVISRSLSFRFSGRTGFVYFHRISPARRGGYFHYSSPINCTL
jgi:hypothetical protein